MKCEGGLIRCPFCDSVKIDNYGLVNVAEDINTLKIDSVMVYCGGCHEFYWVRLEVIGILKARGKNNG